MQLLWICAGGALGSGARYLVTLWSVNRFGGVFPYGTISINVIGCFAISLVMHMAFTMAWSETARLAVVTGVLGGFTTYSAFNYDTLRLLSQGMPGAAFLNVTLTLLGGLASGWLGLLAGRVLFNR